YSLIHNLSKPVLRMLYYNLSSDTSLANDKISKEIEERLRLIILLKDPSIIIDLRTSNRFQGSKFDIFWDELNRYFNEIIK
ncbi:3744_t:CDS:1, partial [Funneliformis mosseae]